MKTYITAMSFANQLAGIGPSLAKFHILPKEKPPGAADGDDEDIYADRPELLPDPYVWPHVTLCTDHSSDNVCMEHAFHYRYYINCSFEHDKDHGTQRMHIGALKQAGLWSHQVQMCELSWKFL